MTGEVPDRHARTVARLAAVQALYQIALNGTPAPLAVEEFRAHRLSGDFEGVPLGDADRAFFEDIVLGVVARAADIDSQVNQALSKGRSLARVEAVLAAILRAGAYELTARVDVPAAVVIDEYVEIAKSFFDAAQVGLVNGVLDRLAREIRPAELAARAAG
ncbi:MAG: transcription antitermination factor NusB [Alphaproteobacteria bacterium]|nr:transcription antitermination factor NusB [Alphaproteobacteria bacterium]